jgi:voltage-gated potassium channel
VVAVPMLRPLRIVRSVRILRLLRLSRLTAVAGVGAEKSKKSLHSRATNYVLFVMGTLIVMSSVAVLDLERDSKAANIKSIGDALWWAVSTVTTVGYGDRYPVTAGGRAVAVILMIGGIALLGVITAAIAAYFVEQNRGRAEASNPEVEILARLKAIEEALVRLGAMSGEVASTTSDPGS